MKLSLTQRKMKKIKYFVFQHGRLLERKLFQNFFEDGSIDACLDVLRTYQNADGGFGNGLEPDLLCPDSTPIAMETAFYYLDMLDRSDEDIINKSITWLQNNLNSDGTLPYPPESLKQYPHQPWWSNPDRFRILSIVSYLKKWNINAAELYANVHKYFELCILPHPLQFYDYPYYMYLKYFPHTEIREIQWKQVNVVLPELFEREPKHYPLIGRHWYLSMDNFSKKEQELQVQLWIEGLQDDGGLEIVYQDLFWWRPIWTMDGLMVMKKFNLVNI
ncbi:MAG: hypothetical protein JEZ00_10155 [Anaerolineaceae bacterium]|nr:hypothetical protein [Anaerolineaceae bacterium]